MVKITCHNYGFDCAFEITGNNSIIIIIEKYQKHSTDEHKIEYSIVVEQFLMRNNY